MNKCDLEETKYLALQKLIEIIKTTQLDKWKLRLRTSYSAYSRHVDTIGLDGWSIGRWYKHGEMNLVDGDFAATDTLDAVSVILYGDFIYKADLPSSDVTVQLLLKLFDDVEEEHQRQIKQKVCERILKAITPTPDLVVEQVVEKPLGFWQKVARVLAWWHV